MENRKMKMYVTREDIERFVQENADMKPHCKHRFLVSVLPRFNTLTEFYNCNLDQYAKGMGRKCGSGTLEICKSVKDFMYQFNATEEAREKAVEDAKRAEQARIDLEDPFIPADQVHQLAEIIDLLKLPGIRYRKFLEFVQSVSPENDLITMK